MLLLIPGFTCIYGGRRISKGDLSKSEIIVFAPRCPDFPSWQTPALRLLRIFGIFALKLRLDSPILVRAHL